MKEHIDILEIMEKTIDTLKDNKEIVITIIKDLQTDYEQKKLELEDIKRKLPDIIQETTKIRNLDKELRQQLMMASNDFSAAGHKTLKAIFDQASTIHTQLFKAEDTEQYYIHRRNTLEMELKKIKFNIQLAENMAHQLIASLSYLQTGVNDLNEKSSHPSPITLDADYAPVLTAFKCIEDEKSRIARDLHDGPVQRIASVQMRIDFCKTAVTLDLEKGLSLLEHLKQDLACTLSEVRDILFDLNPAPLEKLGLKACIEHILYNALDKLSMQIHFSYDLEEPSLNPSIQNSIYRIIQELVSNTKKHAQATSIRLKLHTSNDFIYITLEDNGVGFQVPEDFELMRAHNKSYGLFNIYTRIKNLNGLLKVDSQPDKGSCFKIQLPILLS